MIFSDIQAHNSRTELYIFSFSLARFFRVCRRIQACFDEKPVQTEPTGAIFPRFRHVCIARVVQAVWRWSGLEGGLDQLPRYLAYTKHNNTEHLARLDFLVFTHPQVARSEFVLETAIHPFNRGSLSIALNSRMDKTGSVGRFMFSCQRFLQALVASRVRVDNADTVMHSGVIVDLRGVIGTVHAFVEIGDTLR